jgi:hypothetical protein
MPVGELAGAGEVRGTPGGELAGLTTSFAGTGGSLGEPGGDLAGVTKSSVGTGGELPEGVSEILCVGGWLSVSQPVVCVNRSS